MVETSTAMMTAEQREKWRNDTRREWSAAPKVEAWRVWGRHNIEAQREATVALLEKADLRPGMSVLDVGGGGGDPSLAAAAAVGPAGKVTVTDVSEGMLEVAKEFALEDGLTNLEYHVADADRLPFAGAMFERALVRCVVMFFPDDVGAVREIQRVLKPDGKAAFLAWGTLDANPLFNVMFSAIGKVMTLPQPPPGSPGPFKFAAPGSLSSVLESAGFPEVHEETLTVPSRWNLTPERLVDLMVEMGGLHWLLGQMSEEAQQQVLQDATDQYRSFWDGRAIAIPLGCVLATGAGGNGVG